MFILKSKTSLFLLAVLSLSFNAQKAVPFGTGTGNNGDEIEQLYEKSRSLTLNLILPKILPCLSQRLSNLIITEEIESLEENIEIVESLDFTWDSEWPASHMQNTCFETKSDQSSPVYLSWSQCETSNSATKHSVSNILQMMMIKKEYPEAEAAKRSETIIRLIQTNKCGAIF